MEQRERALEWFLRIRDETLALEAEKARIQDLRLQAEGPRGQSYGSCGHGSGKGDPSAMLLAAMQAEHDLDIREAKHILRIELATWVLYGYDGRGGLAKTRTSADADCICGYYLLGMSWREVADEMVRPESKDGPQWCRRRAYRAFEFIDRYGAGRLALS